MSDTQTKPKLFEIKEYKEKVLNCLGMLEKTQQPGEQSGKGNKTTVLEGTKKEIQELINKGFTVKQVADAISEDVFKILPKTITQLINTKISNKKQRIRHTKPGQKETEQTTITQNTEQHK